MAVSALEAVQVIEQQHADTSAVCPENASKPLRTQQINYFIPLCVE